MGLNGVVTDEVSHLQHLKELIEVAKAEPQWPLAERQWLAITSWNNGALQWRGGQLASAEKWCGASLTLLRSCGAAWPVADTMRAAYQQLLASISSSSAH